MACQLPEAISKIEEILSKNGEGIASAMLSGIQINMLNKAKNNLQSVIETRMVIMQSIPPGYENKRPEFDKLPSYKEGQKNMVYAGIGSRETPADILEEMTNIAKELQSSYKLQTGYKSKSYGKINEEGADKAFSDGTNKKELFGPDMATEREMIIAKELHPNWNALVAKGDFAAKLMARNTFQVFGKNLDTPVDFVLFYAQEQKDSIRPKGGTGQAVEMARLKGIPTINMADKNWREQLDKVLIKDNQESKTDTKSSEPDVVDSILNSGIDEKVRDIKISNKDLEILKKENEELTKKTGVSIKWIENDANADFNYNPDDNYVTYVEGFNDTITTVLQNHELKHALTFQYLKKNENDNKVKELIKGVNDFKDRLTELRARESKNAKKDDSESYISKTNDLYERVAYMLENSSDSKISNELRQVAEIVAILSAEKDIREQFLNEFKGDKKSKIKILIYWIKSKLNFSEVKTEYYFSPENIVKNVDKIVKQSSKEYNKDNPNIKYETISKDDIEAAKDIMSNNKKECE